MSKEHRKAADQALVMDAARVIRKDMTLMTELLAKYQGLEGALNGVGQETAAEEVSDLVVPLCNARAALEHVLEALQNAQAPGMPGMNPNGGDDLADADEAARAQETAFDLESAILDFINNNNAVPSAVHIRPDLHDLLAKVWPGRDVLKLPKGKVVLKKGDPAQLGDSPFGFER